MLVVLLAANGTASGATISDIGLTALLGSNLSLPPVPVMASVPEPASILLVGGLFVAAVFWRYRD